MIFKKTSLKLTLLVLFSTLYPTNAVAMKWPSRLPAHEGQKWDALCKQKLGNSICTGTLFNEKEIRIKHRQMPMGLVLIGIHRYEDTQTLVLNGRTFHLYDMMQLTKAIKRLKNDETHHFKTIVELYYNNKDEKKMTMLYEVFQIEENPSINFFLKKMDQI